ncbi:hypothetical protein A0J59_02925 [Cellulosimicrobium sp. I38E]|nr:hypothetical protein A0J59_02925 [Cellulosimicrobium sp. I38E]
MLTSPSFSHSAVPGRYGTRAHQRGSRSADRDRSHSDSSSSPPIVSSVVPSSIETAHRYCPSSAAAEHEAGTWSSPALSRNGARRPRARTCQTAPHAARSGG